VTDERIPHAEGNFPTHSGKCEPASAVAHERGRMLELYRQGCSESDTGGAVDALPDYRVESSVADDGLFLLISPKTHHSLNSRYANMTTKPEGFAEQRVWIHPQGCREKRNCGWAGRADFQRLGRGGGQAARHQ